MPERAIPINDVLHEVLLKIFARKKSPSYPFCSINGMKLNQSRRLFECKKIGKSAGIKGRVFLHKFRHTFATHLIKRRVPIEVIQKLLGHATIHQSMVYLHIRSEDLHTDVARLNDLANLSDSNPSKD
ncbi:MAG: tyrosine-type recombinase/integrase [Melioribacteraceae bacterium]|nr:tyrosine-type recombinase/integrase [Melioribacteraceae bacterium]